MPMSCLVSLRYRTIILWPGCSMALTVVLLFFMSRFYVLEILKDMVIQPPLFKHGLSQLKVFCFE